MMLWLGFSVSWVQLVLRCVSLVSYSFILNGEVCGNIKPSRGLRQGEPLSPFLFLICDEGLSSLIHKAQSNINLFGFKCSTQEPAISHFFFDDDSLLFTKANERNCMAVRKVLEDYEGASGQQVNLINPFCVLVRRSI
ncbi:hypothetical protein Dsin_027458 [Dipteronia sinensis]|uniref:Reverse transcriptase domain-containing protein n=1 Tax=Dipteronia sinensis TaxID=43782 RepID=A0AAD9ZPZ2_9ROSI|nr:hypothetical protein Dsin_027458 [Dipteronia sinensis]